MKIIEALKNRRVWAAIFAALAFILSMCGVNIGFDANNLTDIIMRLVNDVSALLAVILPLLSYLKPKK